MTRKSMVFAVVFLLFVGCSSEPKLGFGEVCGNDQECKTSRCAYLYGMGGLPGFKCTYNCADTPCPSHLACGISRDGSNVCMPPCEYGYSYDGATCVDGALVACDFADERYCEDCGCLGHQLVCRMRYNDPEGPDPPYCGPMGVTGEPCTSLYECASGHCDLTYHVCGVELGAECTSTNCRTCIDTGVSTFCTHGCYSDGQCLSGWGCAQRLYPDTPDEGNLCWKKCGADFPPCPPGLQCGAVQGASYLLCV